MPKLFFNILYLKGGVGGFVSRYTTLLLLVMVDFYKSPVLLLHFMMMHLVAMHSENSELNCIDPQCKFYKS